MNEYDLHRYIYLAFIVKAIKIVGIRRLSGLLWLAPVYIGLHIYSSIDVIPISIGLFTPFFSILCLYVACVLFKPEYKVSCVSSYLVGYFSSIALGIFRPYTRLEEILAIDFVEGITTLRFAALSFDPNYFTILSVITIFILLFNYGIEIKSKSLWLALVGITVASAAMTFSKSFYISLALVLSLMIVKAPAQTRRNILLALPIIGFFALAFWSQIQNVIDIMAVRFDSANDVNGLTTGRADIWDIYLYEMTQSPDKMLFGNGFLDLERAAHNTYIEIVFKFGTIGLISDILYIIYCSYIVDQKTKYCVTNLSLVVLFAALLSMLNFYTFYQEAICVFMLIIMIKDTEFKYNS